METTNIVVSLDTRRPKKDGTFPLVFRVGHQSRTTSIPTGISIYKKDWDEKTRLIKKTYSGVSSVSRLNNWLQKKKSEAMDIILKLKETDEVNAMSVTAIRSKIARENDNASFFVFTQKLIDDLVKTNCIGTARCYKGVAAIVKTFTQGKDITFRDINYPFLSKLETSHKMKGNNANGLSVYMRTIRAIYNKAIKEGIAEKELYPFSNYKIKSAPTEKRALDGDLLRKIVEVELQPNDLCFDARNYFLASYMMYGMNFTDMAYLLKTDIANGRIVYRRKKTSKIYDIKITDNLNSILTYYSNQNPETGYIFPIIKRETAFLQAKDIQWARKRYNKKLKALALLCGIDKNLTSYVSRHSFATQAMLQEIPLNAISTMLGHSSLKTTEIYLKSLPSNVLDNYNSLVLQNL